MIVLDENIFESQRLQSRRWRIQPCQIVRDVGRRGMQDEEIIPLLRTLRRPTLVTRDRDFFQSSLCDVRYCLVQFRVDPVEVAAYLRRLIRHPNFKTWSQRKGRVLRVSPGGISVWQVRNPRLRRYRWTD